MIAGQWLIVVLSDVATAVKPRFLVDGRERRLLPVFSGMYENYGRNISLIAQTMSVQEGVHGIT